MAKGYFGNEFLIWSGFSGLDQGYFKDGSLGNFLKLRNGAQTSTLHTQGQMLRKTNETYKVYKLYCLVQTHTYYIVHWGKEEAILLEL